ncbi:MAG: 3-methyl-2-oxobutanoate hydroxymethyltransferase [Gammaproteobacteria bacterium]|nr:3-methyl-2-oxobutanoate hydroxymethyltransferase [Gammaproteobacteria bacterium]
MRYTNDHFLKKKKQGEKTAVLTAYDASFAQLMENAGVEIILVGDSLGMVVQGNDSTIPVSIDDMIYHTQCVSHQTQQVLIMADLPFATTYNTELCYHNAARLLAEGGAQMVKIEGGQIMLDTVQFLTQRSIPVCAHLGLLPQSVYRLGGYKVQGKKENDAQQILDDAIAMEAVGADMILLECVPADLAKKITQAVQIPVIGIGAGKDCDAQVLVSYDMLGMSLNGSPSFSHNFLADLAKSDGEISIKSAFEAYVNAVQSGIFPH